MLRIIGEIYDYSRLNLGIAQKNNIQLYHHDNGLIPNQRQCHRNWKFPNHGIVKIGIKLGEFLYNSPKLLLYNSNSA